MSSKNLAQGQVGFRQLKDNRQTLVRLNRWIFLEKSWFPVRDMTACNLFVWGVKLFNKRIIGRKLSILFIAKYYSFVKILSYTASDMFKVWRKGFLDCRLGIRVSGCLGVGVLCQQDSDFGPYLYLQAPEILHSFQTFVIM